MIILHYTGMESGKAAEDWLCNADSQVSSHYLVHEDGSVVQMVRETDRAWHAGASSWKGHTDINSRSVGIEIVNPGHAFGYVDFPDAQIRTVIALCLGIIDRHRILPVGVLAHSDVAPGRKVDPGEKFPWRRLFEAGVGLWVEPECAGVAEPDERTDLVETQRKLRRYGYGLDETGECDDRTQVVLAAFQRHFRPERIDGIADASTISTLERLIRAQAAVS